MMGVLYELVQLQGLHLQTATSIQVLAKFASKLKQHHRSYQSKDFNDYQERSVISSLMELQ